MPYKIKSLLYLVCFLVSAAMYYSLDHDLQLETLANKEDLAEVDLPYGSSNGVVELEELK